MSKKHTGQIVNKRLTDAGRKDQMVNTDDYVDANTAVDFICGSAHVYHTTPHNVLNKKSGCPECMRLSYIKPVETLTQDLLIRYITMQDYHGMDKSTTFHCLKCDKDWRAKPRQVVHSKSGCPRCAKSSFNPDAPAIFYGVKFSIDGIEFGKFGITGNSHRRYAAHRKHGMIDVVWEIPFNIGAHAQQTELWIKSNFGGSYVSKDILPDGWTETLPLHLFEEVKGLLERL